jgi:hypothetical protein
MPIYDPNNSFFAAGLLLCFTFGITLAGIHESVLAGDWIWFWIFAAGEGGVVALYFWNVWCWVRFPNPANEYDDVPEDIDLELRND